jgi:hypothetical protein
MDGRMVEKVENEEKMLKDDGTHVTFRQFYFGRIISLTDV